MRKYTEAKSNFVKEKIKNSSFENGDYVDDLLKIEHYVLGGDFGLPTGYIVKELERNYSNEFKLIWQELEPKEYAKLKSREKEEKKKEKKEEEADRRESLREDAEMKRDWLKAGGRA